MKSSVLSFLWGFIATAPLSAIVSPSPAPTPGTFPIKILSDQMDCDQNHNVCIAKGNAVAEKLGDSKTKILKADQITAHFAKEGETGPLKVTRLEGDGNVFFIIGDIIIQGKHGNYAMDAEVAKVSGNVRITHGNNQLDGSDGEVNMKTGRYSIKRNGERVQALIFPKDQIKKDPIK